MCVEQARAALLGARRLLLPKMTKRLSGWQSIVAVTTRLVISMLMAIGVSSETTCLPGLTIAIVQGRTMLTMFCIWVTTSTRLEPVCWDVTLVPRIHHASSSHYMTTEHVSPNTEQISIFFCPTSNSPGSPFGCVSHPVGGTPIV